jgi:SsrA-binding protein
MVLIVKNKRAFYEYEILEQYTCGIKLHGSEVKSIKNNKVSISEAYCFIDENLEVFLRGSHITPHKEGGKHFNHVPVRDRKLLMKKKEIIKLKEKIGEKGFTLVPLSVIITDSGFIKVEIGLGRGKKLYDKREAIKTKDLTRENNRQLN